MKHFLILIVLIGLIFVASGLHAQEGPTAEMQEKMRKINAQQRAMIAKQQFMMQLATLQYKPGLRKELEIVDDQITALSTLSRNFVKEQSGTDLRSLMDESREHFRDGQRNEGAAKMREYQEGLSKLTDEYTAKVSEILLPHQMKRLQQVSKQKMLRTYSQFKDEFGMMIAVGKELGLDKEVRGKFENAVNEARKEYYEKLAALRKETSKKMLDALPAKKQKELRALVGEYYNQK